MPEFRDLRQHAPAAERNREPIYAVLATALPATGTVLEIASGTGQHAVFLAPQLAPRHWLPSDPNPIARDSIRSWRASDPTPTLHDPLDLDVTQSDWLESVRQWQATAGQESPDITAIVNINMIHIAPWAACEGLVAGAASLLQPGGILYLYGPYRQNGVHTAPSNEAFDRSLRSQNPAWGIRNLDDVVAIAADRGFYLTRLIQMPANNLSVILTRGDRPEDSAAQ